MDQIILTILSFLVAIIGMKIIIPKVILMLDRKARVSRYGIPQEKLIELPESFLNLMRNTNINDNQFLIQAASTNNIEVVTALLPYYRTDQDKIDAMDKQARTALWYAIVNNNLGMVKLLIENGANIDLCVDFK